jgi:hypothetical protein
MKEVKGSMGNRVQGGAKAAGDFSVVRLSAHKPALHNTDVAGKVNGEKWFKCVAKRHDADLP